MCLHVHVSACMVYVHGCVCVYARMHTCGRRFVFVLCVGLCVYACLCIGVPMYVNVCLCVLVMCRVCMHAHGYARGVQ